MLFEVAMAAVAAAAVLDGSDNFVLLEDGAACRSFPRYSKDHMALAEVAEQETFRRARLL